jgi:hypothetical protein
MAETVYVLCALTSTACAGLLARGFMRNRTSLLLWSSLCFAILAVNNLLLFVDLVVVTDVDLSLWRSSTALIAFCVLIFGLVWEVK